MSPARPGAPPAAVTPDPAAGAPAAAVPAPTLAPPGTPHFIVGDKIIPGAPENLSELLAKHAADVRKDGCKVC